MVKPKKIGKYPIPFDPKNGNQQAYPENRYGQGEDGKYFTIEPIWEDNFEFVDNLTYVSYRRGRSAIGFEFTRGSSGKTVNVFMNDMNKWIPHLVNGVISGKFTFMKRGMNYGCTMIEKTDNFENNP